MRSGSARPTHQLEPPSSTSSSERRTDMGLATLCSSSQLSVICAGPTHDSGRSRDRWPPSCSNVGWRRATK